MSNFEFSPQCRRCPARKDLLNLLGISKESVAAQARQIDIAAKTSPPTRVVGGLEVDAKTAIELSILSAQQRFNLATPQQRVDAHTNVLEVLSEASTVCSGPRRVGLMGKLCGMEFEELNDFPFKDELGCPETVHHELVQRVREAKNAANNLKFN